MQTDLGIDVNTTNIAVSITALFSGIFIVVIGVWGISLVVLKRKK